MPKPRSIDDIIRRHPRERLFVQPAEWRARHLELLHCSFEDDSEVSPGQETNEEAKDEADPQKKPVDRWTRTADRLATSEMKTAAIKKLLAEGDGPLKFMRPFGYFCFGSDHEFRIHGTVFSQRPSATQAPVFAFMQRGMIRIQREGLLPLPRPRRPNPPAEELRRLRLKKLEPSDPWRDPYIVVVLLGLAQSQLESASKREDSSSVASQNFRVCALLVDEKNTDFMCFYTASISATFLRKFEYPSSLEPPRSSTMGESLSIRYRKVSFQPYSTLRARLIEGLSFCLDEVPSSD
ncbi:hypothetical protein ACJZ2D_015336 [Fusarium nematophilum]